MKFAFVIFKYFPFGGAQRDMLRTASNLIAMGHAVDVYTLSWEGQKPHEGIQVHVIPVRAWLNYRKYQQFIDIVLARLRDDPDVDYIVGYNRMPGLDAYFAADPCFRERAYQERSPLYRLTGRYRFFAKCEEAIFSRDANCEVLLLSLREMPVFQRWYGTPDARFHLQPPVISADRFRLGERAEIRADVRQEFGFGVDDKLLLLVGSGFKTKGLDRVIQAVAALPDELKFRTRLLAVGQDNPTTFRKMAQALGVSEQVIIVTGRNDIPRLMQAADLLVHPAYRENTGLVLLEAMATGLPVLASDVCGYAFHVQESGAGALIVSPFKQEAFNHQVAEMLTSPVQSEWREHGLRHAAKIMASNDGSAEARMLETFACRKMG